MKKESNNLLLLKPIEEPIKKILIDITEMECDSIIHTILKDDSLIEKIPILKWGFLATKITAKIQLAFFIKKFALFIGPINKASYNITDIAQTCDYCR